MDESFVKYTAARHRPRILRRALSAFTAITGGLILTAACAAGVRQAAKSFSVTNIAKRCFPYPESSVGDDAEPGEAAGELAEEIARSLLSSAFFGSDALYFDLAGENTEPKPRTTRSTRRQYPARRPAEISYRKDMTSTRSTARRSCPVRSVSSLMICRRERPA